MQIFEFTVTNNSKGVVTVEAPDVIEAMDFANEIFGCLPQGVWMETLTKNNPKAKAFRWAKGNFFD